MTPFNTPRCRITGTTVTSGGVARNLVVANQLMTLFMHVWIDPTLSQVFGIWSFNFRLRALRDPGGDPQEDRSGHWAGLLSNLPYGGGYFNPNITWNRATDLTSGEQGWYVFDPNIYIRVAGVSNHQFAWAEQPHHILITDGS
jgi:hypothetical protein